jgi:hypothetical protein
MKTEYNEACERFGITHFSSQSINLFLANIPLFILKYCKGYKGPQNAAMLRGSSADKMIGEAVADLRISVENMENRADKYFDSAIDDLEDTPENIEKEKQSLKSYVRAGVPFYRKLGKPVSYQQQVNLDFDDLPTILGYCDLEYQDMVRDIKTTTRTPSKIPEQVSRQLCIYATALEKPKACADYIVVTKTTSNVVTFDCDDINLRLDEVYRAASAMMNLLYNNDINSLRDQFYPDFSDWRWDQHSIEAAKKFWSIK